MQVNLPKRQAVTDLITAHSGQFFSVLFVKRTDGTIRLLNGHLTDTKHKTRPVHKFNPEAKGLLPVYDVKKSEWRYVNLDGVLRVTIAGRTYSFEEPQCPGIEDPGVTFVSMQPKGVRKEAAYQAAKAELDRLFY